MIKARGRAKCAVSSLAATLALPGPVSRSPGDRSEQVGQLRRAMAPLRTVANAAHAA